MRRLLIAFGMLLLAPLTSANSVWDDSTLNKILQRGELRIGIETGYMPFEMRDKNGDIIGFDVDIAVLTVDDPSFWEVIPALPLPVELPGIMTEVMAVGACPNTLKIQTVVMG